MIKAKLRELIFNQAAMSGVRVLTYSLMSNHFHLLLAVDQPEENRKKLDDETILERLRHVTRAEPLREIRQMLERLKQQSPDGAYPEYRQRLLARMYDLSAFMKEVKQRFSQWFNRREGRRGPLWGDRFKSVLVEGEENLLRALAAYIDLNAVRAGIVRDPKAYRWCGYMPRRWRAMTRCNAVCRKPAGGRLEAIGAAFKRTTECCWLALVKSARKLPR